MSILSIYMVPEILEEGYTFSKSGIYYAPAPGPMADTITYFDSLPVADEPEVFGMHENDFQYQRVPGIDGFFVEFATTCEFRRCW